MVKSLLLFAVFFDLCFEVFGCDAVGVVLLLSSRDIFQGLSLSLLHLHLLLKVEFDEELLILELLLEHVSVLHDHRWATRSAHFVLVFGPLSVSLLLRLLHLLTELLVQLHFLEVFLIPLSPFDLVLHEDLGFEVLLLDLL